MVPFWFAVAELSPPLFLFCFPVNIRFDSKTWFCNNFFSTFFRRFWGRGNRRFRFVFPECAYRDECAITSVFLVSGKILPLWSYVGFLRSPYVRIQTYKIFFSPYYDALFSKNVD